MDKDNLTKSFFIKLKKILKSDDSFRKNDGAEFYKLEFDEFFENGVDVNAQDEYGYTALNYAIDFASIGLTKFLLTKDVDVNKKGFEGFTALQRSIVSPSETKGLKITLLLLEHGADPSIKNQYGHSALDLAIMTRHYDAFTHLLKYGAKFDYDTIGVDGKKLIDTMPSIMREKIEIQNENE